MMAMGGELEGRRYLSRAIIEEAAQEQSYAEDEIIGWCRMGLGFGLDSPEFRGATPTSFHWGGHGGSFLTMDLASGISCAFAPNQFKIGDPLDSRLVGLWEVLGEVSRSIG